MVNSKFPYVFKIITPFGTGSGFFVESPDYVVTNFHVVRGCKMVAIEDQNGTRHVGEIAMVSPTKDLAFIKPQSALNIGGGTISEAQNPVAPQSKVSVLGYPFGMPFSVTEGIVSNLNKTLANHPMIQTDAAVNPGNSGGPVINMEGHIIGVTTSKFTSADNIGFALPIEYVRNELEALKNNTLNTLSVKCYSCEGFVTEPTEHCHSCGAEINAEQFFEQETPNQVVSFVEESLKEKGLDPVLCRAGFEHWNFYEGSAKTSIYVFRNTYIEASCPLVHLPKSNVDKLLNYLLQFNEAPYYLGTFKDYVYLTYRIHLSDLLEEQHKKDLQSQLAGFSKKADDLDDFLIQEFGCLTTQNYKPEAA